MNIYEPNNLEETLDQRCFEYNKSLEIVEHNMIWIQREPWKNFGGIKERR